MDIFQDLVVVLEFLKQLFRVTAILNQGSFISLLHYVSPKLVHSHKLCGFLGELLLNIVGIENVLEVHPLTLAREPFINNIGNQYKLTLPLLYLWPDFSDKSSAQHCLDFQLMIVQSCSDVIQTANNKFILGLSVMIYDETQCSPFLFDILKLRFDSGLSGRSGRNLFHLVLLFHHAICQQFSQCEGLSWLPSGTKDFKNPLPMSRSQIFVAQGLNDRHHFAHILHF